MILNNFLPGAIIVGSITSRCSGNELSGGSKTGLEKTAEIEPTIIGDGDDDGDRNEFKSFTIARATPAHLGSKF